MRIQFIAVAVSLIFSDAGASQNLGENLESPVVYTVETPFQGSRVVILQDPDGMSAAHRPYAGEASPLEPGSETEGGPDALNWRFAGPRTNGKLAKYNTNMLEIIASDPLERGARYVDDSPRAERFDPAEHDAEDAWSATNIEASLEGGARPRPQRG